MKSFKIEFLADPINPIEKIGEYFKENQAQIVADLKKFRTLTIPGTVIFPGIKLHMLGYSPTEWKFIGDYFELNIDVITQSIIDNQAIEFEISVSVKND